VATDGHRLAMNSVAAAVIDNAFAQVIIPRKGVIELLRLLEDSPEEVTVSIMANHIRVANSSFIFTSKLIEGRFPDYDRVLPRGGDKIISVRRELLKQSLSRASILSNEKLRGIQLQLRTGLLRILANNPEHEEAEEEINIDYSLSDLDIGFNVKYLTDIFDTIDDEHVTLTLSDSNSSILVEGNKDNGDSLFVVMPMRL
jgi:DNA polymerase-3 subunit beta